MTQITPSHLIRVVLDGATHRADTHPDPARIKHCIHGDAFYLELATRTGLALATDDRALVKAAESEGILVMAA